MDPTEWAAWAAWTGIVITLGIAVVGWRHARRANQRAAAANDLSAEALELARSAEARADRLEQIARERRDVAWDLFWSAFDSTLAVVNVGTDVAHDVELVVANQPGAAREQLVAGRPSSRPSRSMSASRTQPRRHIRHGRSGQPTGP